MCIVDIIVSGLAGGSGRSTAAAKDLRAGCAGGSCGPCRSLWTGRTLRTCRTLTARAASQCNGSSPSACCLGAVKISGGFVQVIIAYITKISRRGAAAGEDLPPCHACRTRGSLRTLCSPKKNGCPPPGGGLWTIEEKIGFIQIVIADIAQRGGRCPATAEYLTAGIAFCALRTLGTLCSR